MSKNLQQVYTTNPILTNQATDLMYFARSPYAGTDDCGMTYSSFAAQFGAPYTPAALSGNNDTNVTITLGGTPLTALLNAASITMGWTGTLSGTRGGTGINNGSNTATFAGNLNFANSFTTSGNFAVTQTYTGATNVTFPTSGTLATTSQIPTPAALTEVNDTNVTMTLGGTPSTALLQPVSMTLGWAGELSLARGGTNASLTASNGGLFYSTATAGAILAGTATANQVLLSGSSSTPAWSTAIYPGTTTINQLLYSSSANTISGLATANNAVLVTSSGGVPSLSSTLPSAVVNNIPGRLVSRTIFHSGGSGTYTVPANVTSLFIQGVGGGGGGGGSAGGATTYAAGGGGGGGGYSEVFLVSGLSATYAYTVGYGGSGATAGNNAGSNGNPTTFGSTLLSSSGGIGGSGSGGGSVTVAVVAAGGGPGAGTVGDVQSDGFGGDIGMTVLGQLSSGKGGGTPLGGGGQGLVSAGTGNFGNSYGGGGSGGAATTVSQGGGGGADGALIIWEYA